MLAGQLGRPGPCRPCTSPSSPSPAAHSLHCRRSSIRSCALRPQSLRQQALTVTANFNFGGKKDDKKPDDDAKKKSQGFGTRKAGDPKPIPKPLAKPADRPKDIKPAQTSGPGGLGNLGGIFGGSGSGSNGGGSGGFGGGRPVGGGEGGGEGGAEQDILTDLVEWLQSSWVFVANLGIFLAFASFMHRSLGWFVQNDLLVSVGAPQQAIDRIVGLFYDGIEWIERHVLGWDVPDDSADKLKMYEVLAYYTPENAAYSFDQLRYDLNESEKATLLRAHALRHYERPAGTPPANPAEVARIKAKYEPLEADRKAYMQAKATGRLDEYWATRAATYQQVVGTARK